MFFLMYMMFEVSLISNVPSMLKVDYGNTVGCSSVNCVTVKSGVPEMFSLQT